MLTSRDKGIATWKFSLVLADGFLVIGALVIMTSVYCASINAPFVGFWQKNQLAFSLTWVAFMVSFYLSGLYEASRVIRFRPTLLTSGVAVGFGTLVSVLLFYLLMSQKLGRLILLPVALGLWAGLVVVRMLLTRLTAIGFFSQRALIVGGDREAAEAVQLIRNTPQAGLKIYGIVAGTPEMVGKPVEGVPVVGEMSDLSMAVETYSINCLVVAARPDLEWAILKQLRPYRYKGIALLDLMSLHERLAQEIPLSYVNDEWLMSASMNNSRLHIAKLKRLMDISVSLFGLVVTAPICCVAAVLIKLDSRGPVHYRQDRLGRDSVSFELMKFRTMRSDAEAESGPVWAGDNDPRITRVGRWLRKLRIDEIPQLINVLRGEMRLIGPRPERAVFITELAEKIPFYSERLLVQPGITGWAQVNFPYTSSVEETRRKLQYDLYYIKNMSFSLDCLVLIRTIKIVLFARERVHPSTSQDSAVDRTAEGSGRTGNTTVTVAVQRKKV
jgi:exopolysaccharide biosynthesis polyprenyl glycosylphosphotransferase